MHPTCINKLNYSHETVTSSSEYIDEISYFHLANKAAKSFPYPTEEVMPGVLWGSFDRFYTPAYWKLEYCLKNLSEIYDSHRLGDNVVEEVVACLLGGYGLPAETGISAFKRLKEKRLIYFGVSEKAIREELMQPFYLKNNKKFTYRFYNQKSNYIAQFLGRADLDRSLTQDDLTLRSWLLEIKGIGPKTASWITRNWLHSENVAIIDIHILRAGIITGFFDIDSNVQNQYFSLEKKYLAFCRAIDVLPSHMDALMWSNMRRSSKIALKVLKLIR